MNSRCLVGYSSSDVEEHEQTLQLCPMLQYCMICDGQFMGQADDSALLHTRGGSNVLHPVA